MLFISVLQTAIELNESTFDSFIAAHEYVFVDFFTPWCDQCKVLKPKWDKLSENSIWPVADVDCTKTGALCNNKQVFSYPQLKLYHKGEPINCEADHEYEPLRGWLRANTRNEMVPLTKQELKQDSKRRGLKVFFVVYGPKDTHAELQKKFLFYPAFFYIIEAEQKSLVAHQDGYTFPLNLSLNLTKVQIDSFVQQHQRPFIPELNKENIYEMDNIPGKTLVIIVDGNDDMEQLIQTYMVNGLSSLAFMKSFIFAKASQKYVYSLIREETAAGQLVFYNGRNPKKVKYGINTLEEGELRDELKKVLDHYDVSKLSVADKPTEAEGEEAREEVPVQKQEQKKERQEEKKEDVKQSSESYRKVIDEELDQFITKDNLKQLAKGKDEL